MKREGYVVTNTKNRYYVAVLLLIIVAQIGLSVFFGTKKIGFFVDEYLTFTFANQEGGFVSNVDGFLESWQEPQFFHDALTVQEGEKFHFGIPFRNNAFDDHPPLYSYIIHFASSLTPDVFSKWTGIIPNIFFNIISTLLFYSLSKKCWATLYSLLRQQRCGG